MKRNLISKIAPGGGILFCLKKFVARRFVPLVMVVLIVLGYSDRATGQLHNCGFDELNSENSIINIENEIFLQEEMENNPLAIMNNQVYTIPVVFHVIHRGFPNDNSNIPNYLITQALQDLNDDFSDTGGTGNNVQVQFCLAKRDPSGQATTGINRVSGASIPSYINSGISTSNQVEVKSLSIWPNTEYLNIWIVHRISGNGFLGNATFPGTNSNIDGIVLTSSIVGDPNDSGIITHEAGHFLGLYHTFNGGSVSNCPLNNNCLSDGDKVCDTKAHKTFSSVPYPCNEAEYNNCELNFPFQNQVSKNYMNYTENQCKTEFTPKQITRMRCNLILFRSSLKESLGCLPVCNSVIADFNLNTNVGYAPLTVQGINLSTGANSYLWSVTGLTYSTTNLEHTFTSPGTYEICLLASNNGCINENCKKIEILYDILNCNNNQIDCQASNLIINGDFSVNNIGNAAVHFGTFLQANYIKYDENICNWNLRFGTPAFCSTVGLDDWILLYRGQEAIVTKNKVPLVKGNKYILEFEYLDVYTGQLFNDYSGMLYFGFTDNNSFGFDESNLSIIDAIKPTPEINGTYVACYNTEYTKVSFPFTYNFESPKHFSFATGLDLKSHYIHIRNVKLTCSETECNANINFTYNQDKCVFDFQASSSDTTLNNFTWDFGDGTSGIGQNISHTYLYPGTFHICVTVSCDLENSVTECLDITIDPASCQSKCKTISPISATLCQKEDTDIAFLTNFCFNVPKGFKACSQNGLYVDADDVSIAVTSTFIDVSNPGYDKVCVAAYITPLNGYDLNTNSTSGHITMCNQDSMICMEFVLSGTKCDNCVEQEILATATCDDPIATDNLYRFCGSLNLGSGVVGDECGHVSADAGLVGTLSGVPGNYTYNYCITSTQNGNFTVNDILCFEINGIKTCQTLRINLLPCDPPVDECTHIEDWAVKDYECTTVEEGQAIFNFGMTFEGELCPGGITATMNGASSVVINSYSQNGRWMSFDATFKFDCPFNQSLTYTLEIKSCDGNGGFNCYRFPLRLKCANSLCDNNNGGGVIGFRSKTDNRIILFPNPAGDQLNVVMSNKIPNFPYTISNPQGQPILFGNFSQLHNVLDISQLQSGVYFLTTEGIAGEADVQRFIVIH